ncbi:hypothetical protein COW36_00605 [bacterium (Candidatus Blackallbacteria) CG17_big_fil_post_rev_8_21_14_2_50_48_46]|uniref:Uncharacterized protein n=1 Tax=bacterium (Candidatus Blackallbacteria) CG17_big_fil_post_rev_8_21_14_2_50_48_46 TaxID=2014261 RepID=A0A2M7GBR8_9BACT|nr:MAG: hypothetical protein COW64_10570 [bacterium (Candidatus Blackallbacteria) CG18_big_fil_WC_8_21_14_2_50_49_26]PIW19373.1 MAG: hypothetical protein COW36_00605 [bacterium (Candidatus Blackallbacteria) CG17_big_fil_post_rev_8_21_14_2_50_48_46]PIW49023.1 MAG: hypothetical protein COW20_07850 [bacterium (Candidatus Blackallbacteria) CG13_big_fil_rev_8_21_14_2_50_49_14]
MGKKFLNYTMLKFVLKPTMRFTVCLTGLLSCLCLISCIFSEAQFNTVSETAPPRSLHDLKNTESKYILVPQEEIHSVDQYGNRRLQIHFELQTPESTVKDLKFALVRSLKTYQQQYQIIWVSVSSKTHQPLLQAEWFSAQMPKFQKRSQLKPEEEFRSIFIDYLKTP